MLNHSIHLSGLANHFVAHGILDSVIAKRAQQAALQEQTTFVHHLVSKKILSADEIVRHTLRIFEMEYVDLDQHAIVIEKFSFAPELIKQFRIIPLQKTNQILTIGTTDPTDQQALDAVTFHTGCSVQTVLINDDQVTQWLIKNGLHETGNKKLQLNLLHQIHQDDASHQIQENITPYDEPMIQFVNNIIAYALQKNASDIHIEPFESHCRVRLRVHGVLLEMDSIPHPLMHRVITRIKVMAKLDIAEKRLPQDGRFQFQSVDIRINTCPTLFGEKLVLRLLNAQRISLDIDALQFTPEQKKLFLTAISKPQGMILVTGPTGSGKTVTLYSALNYLNHTEKNISTVEDPIEIRLAGINQVCVNNKIGLQFSNVLRTFLRQDPDIIMVGEIRDAETAEIAIQAAQTGHLVLSTLHTNSAIEAINRLQAIGMTPYQIANSVSLIIAQRLLRKLCPHCKIPETDSTLHRANGCAHCVNGFVERMGIYEILPVTNSLNKLIHAGADKLKLLEQAKNEGFCTLHEAGLLKVNQGFTSLAELNRVLG